MLSVSPPLHQDFRARQMLCSPGDGWRAYVPPPPPTVQPAFHFLSSLLEPGAYAPVQPRPKPRPTLDVRLHGKLSKVLSLPVEVMDQIVEHVVDQGGGHDLSLASRYFHHRTTPYLYRQATLHTFGSVALLNRTLEARPELGAHLRAMSFKPHRLPWTEMGRMADLLGAHAVRIETLRINIPASDLHHAMPFFAALSPTTFEWTTSPCWQMKPAHLFVTFLTRWTGLQHLSLQNFRFDETLAACVDRMPSLRQLCLRGSGSEHVQVEDLLALLQPSDVDGRQAECLEEAQSTHSQPSVLHVEISHCSPTRRASLEAGLVAASCPTDALQRLCWT